MFKEEIVEIEKVINNYFLGIFNGDTDKLVSCFGENVYLYGDINGAPYLKPLEDYIEGVKQRKSPCELGEEFKMQIISVDVLGAIAMTKLHVPMLGYNYYDYLSLSKIEGNWKIVNKLFTHVN